MTIRRSKTDREGAGATVAIPLGADERTCPVLALRRWLEAAAIGERRVFRRIDRHGNLGPALSDRALAKTVASPTAAVGLEGDFAEHSLRSGFATAGRPGRTLGGRHHAPRPLEERAGGAPLHPPRRPAGTITPPRPRTLINLGDPPCTAAAPDKRFSPRLRQVIGAIDASTAPVCPRPGPAADRVRWRPWRGILMASSVCARIAVRHVRITPMNPSEQKVLKSIFDGAVSEMVAASAEHPRAANGLCLEDLTDVIAVSSNRLNGAERYGEWPAIVGLPPPPPNRRGMYAITFDLDTDTLQQVYPGDSWRNAYGEIRKILIEEGFEWQQGSVYFGDPETIDAVTCVLAAQRLARELDWFSEAVRDIRMLRIEENNDLGPAVANQPRRRR
ncbi:MAG: hypothetical protein ACLPYS_20185 [Vulcanimicrobiaceae bacterium]